MYLILILIHSFIHLLFRRLTNLAMTPAKHLLEAHFYQLIKSRLHPAYKYSHMNTSHITNKIYLMQLSKSMDKIDQAREAPILHDKFSTSPGALTFLIASILPCDVHVEIINLMSWDLWMFRWCTIINTQSALQRRMWKHIFFFLAGNFFLTEFSIIHFYEKIFRQNITEALYHYILQSDETDMDDIVRMNLVNARKHVDVRIKQML